VNADEVLELSDERDQHDRRLLDAVRRAYLDGYRDGHADACREQDENWRQTPPLRIAAGPAYAVLEQLRYGPGGREHFGDPRPGDFPGRRESAA
jgi:hypothetical protein